jgi:glutaredoxin-related protein
MGERSESRAAPLVRIFGRHGSPLCYAIRDFLYRSDVPFEYVELTTQLQLLKRVKGLYPTAEARGFYALSL